jgi:hypothetical protein
MIAFLMKQNSSGFSSKNNSKYNGRQNKLRNSNPYSYHRRYNYENYPSDDPDDPWEGRDDMNND